MTTHDFTALPDLASRAFGGSVSAANDELFAQRENLIIGPKRRTSTRMNSVTRKGVRRMGNPSPPRRRARLRHRTARHTGNHPRNHRRHCVFQGQLPTVRLGEAASIEGYPSVEEIMKRTGRPSSRSPRPRVTPPMLTVADRHRWTHVRLSIYPDGGVARLRVHGEVVPDPRFLDGTLDLLAAENGGRLVGCSDAFYASRRTSSFPAGPATWGKAGRTRADAVAATTLRCSPLPQPDAHATSRSTPATTSVTHRDGCA